MTITIHRTKWVTVKHLLEAAAKAMESTLKDQPIRYAQSGEIFDETGVKIGAWTIRMDGDGA